MHLHLCIEKGDGGKKGNATDRIFYHLPGGVPDYHPGWHHGNVLFFFEVLPIVLEFQPKEYHVFVMMNTYNSG